MGASSPMTVRFWGTRGSISCPGPKYQKYGGNTSCLEVRCGDHLVILDGGTGLRELGLELHHDGPLDADVLLTHTHLDHIGGIPFFDPFFDDRNRFRLWAGHLDTAQDLRQVLRNYMAAPLFPIPPALFAAELDFREFDAGTPLEPRPGITIRTARLNHPNGATGFRVEHRGRSICYVTDTEHTPGSLDPSVLRLIRGADMVVYDCTYTDEEFPGRIGWGHSTWEQGIRLCEAAGANQLVIFHHDPAHDDAFMDEVARKAEARRPGTVVAREGAILPVG